MPDTPDSSTRVPRVSPPRPMQFSPRSVEAGTAEGDAVLDADADAAAVAGDHGAPTAWTEGTEGADLAAAAAAATATNTAADTEAGSRSEQHGASEASRGTPLVPAEFDLTASSDPVSAVSGPGTSMKEDTAGSLAGSLRPNPADFLIAELVDGLSGLDVGVEGAEVSEEVIARLTANKTRQQLEMELEWTRAALRSRLELVLGQAGMQDEMLANL